MAAAKQLKPKACRVCKDTFTPFNSLTVVCSVACSMRLAEKKAEAKVKKAKKLERREFKKARTAHKESDRPLQIKLCQSAVNWHVKHVLQKGKPCYTCGAKVEGKAADTGHWKTKGAHPEKRFNTEINLRIQCVPCNRYNGGRPDVFEANLRDEMGDKAVDEFVASKPPKLTTPEIVELKKHFLKLNREAKKLMETK